jgi:hypothetical protein
MSQVIDRIRDTKTTTAAEVSYYDQLEEYARTSPGSMVEKFQNFTKFTPRQYTTRFLTRYEMFKRVLPIQGNIIECGVFLGGGLMSFAQFSAIFEPVNHQRRIIGFDTFAGFPSLHAKDLPSNCEHAQVGALASNAYDDLSEAIKVFDRNRFINHIPKVELVKGDATKTIPAYMEANKHMVVSLLYLDFDIYEPTKVALEAFLPRMPKGSILAFDELNSDAWPGETLAVLETVGLSKLRIERFPFDSLLSYAVIE